MWVALAVLLPAAPIGAFQLVPSHMAPAGDLAVPVSHGNERSAEPTLRSMSVPSSTTHPRPAVHVAGSQVDPLTGHSGEPAPMGIADFGVTGVGAGSHAYEYATSSFLGTAAVDSMNLAIGSGATPDTLVAFELNAVIVLRLGGQNYSYWIQNGLHVNTTTDEYTIGGAYVWNFSSPGAHFSSSEVRGNASSVLSGDTYYFIPTGCTFPGECSTIAFPATLEGRINLTESGGFPALTYAYNLGSGWVTYDTVSFLHMADAALEGFVVNGFAPTPYATQLYYDAEWDWVGAGGGSSGKDRGSDLDLSLQFWNGHNYQAVPSAWDFGGDTGESSYNVTDSLDVSDAAGSPYAHLASGSGTLGVLYNQTSVGFLNVTTPGVSAGTLLVDGAPTAFNASVANLTLAPGTYTVSLAGFSNATERVTIAPGETHALDLSGAGWTSFTETGLPAGTAWRLTIDGVNRSSTAPTLAFNLPNGTYSILYGAVAGYVRNSDDPTSVLVPTSGSLAIVWGPFFFAVSVSESGLPSGTEWWVNTSGLLARGSTDSIEVPAPNGSTPFTTGAPYEFLADPATGLINVTAGIAAPLVIAFAYRSTYIAGTISPTDAQVTIGGVAQTVTRSAFNDSVIPGTYTLVASATGFLTKTIDVNATPGNTTEEPVVLTAVSSSNANSTSAGTFGLSTLEIVGIVVVVIVVIAAVVIARRRSGST
jgi:Thermopsin